VFVFRIEERWREKEGGREGEREEGRKGGEEGITCLGFVPVNKWITL
jgi:hypothetical protein